jgi:hypothetical protein
MESDEKNIVGEQHEPAELIRKSVLAKNIISKITCCVERVLDSKVPRKKITKHLYSSKEGLTNILDLRVSHNVLVHCEGRYPKENAGENHREKTWNPS